MYIGVMLQRALDVSATDDIEIGLDNDKLEPPEEGENSTRSMNVALAAAARLAEMNSSEYGWLREETGNLGVGLSVD